LRAIDGQWNTLLAEARANPAIGGGAQLLAARLENAMAFDDARIEIAFPRDLALVYWGALVLGVLAVLVGLANNETAYLIAGCFLGIASRIIQAESHHRERQK
jgi:hypothetical protein